MTHSEENKERRLQRRAKNVHLGTLWADCNMETATDSVRVEVSFQKFEGDPEEAGYYRVYTGESDPPGRHPADIAADYVRSYVDADSFNYFSVDDVYPA